jgi:hypothetical protein
MLCPSSRICIYVIFRENESYGTSDRSTFDLILWVCFLFFVVACRRVLLCAANLMSGYCIEVVRSLWPFLLQWRVPRFLPVQSPWSLLGRQYVMGTFRLYRSHALDFPGFRSGAFGMVRHQWSLVRFRYNGERYPHCSLLK